MINRQNVEEDTNETIMIDLQRRRRLYQGGNHDRSSKRWKKIPRGQSRSIVNDLGEDSKRAIMIDRQKN